MMMTLARPLSMVLVGASTLLIGISTSYADQKIYTGAECVRWDESKDPASYINWSRRFNPSRRQELRLACPATKDRKGDLRSSWIRVIDRNPHKRVCARIVAVRHVGKSLVSLQGRRKCTKAASHSGRSVKLDTGGLRRVPAGAHYYFSVSVPKRHQKRASGVVSYRLNEANGQD